MRVAKLKELTESSLISTNVAESTYSEYSSGDSYSTGATVKVSYESDGTTPKWPIEEYESNEDSNSGNYPPDNTTNGKWIPLGSENRWQMFDEYLNSNTENTETIEVEIDASGCNVVGLFGLQAVSVAFIHYSTISEKRETKSETIDLMTEGMSGPVGWYAYFFETREYKRDLLWEFPQYASGTLKITITYLSGGVAKCSMCAVGKQTSLGRTQYSPSLGISDFSIKTRDDFGRLTTSKGDWAKENNYDLWFYTKDVDRIYRVVADLRGERVIFDGNNEGVESIYESLIVYGLFIQAKIIIPGPRASKLQFEIEGLIEK